MFVVKVTDYQIKVKNQDEAGKFIEELEKLSLKYSSQENYHFNYSGNDEGS